MNIKDWILPVLLALGTTFLLQKFVLDYYFKPSEVQDSTSEFIAPESQKAYKPLQLDVNFIDKEKGKTEQINEVIASWGTATFSTSGASLQSLDFNHAVDGGFETIRTVFPPSNGEREAACFLIALNESTPYFYELTDYIEESDRVQLSYRARFEYGAITKKYVVHKDKHQIDLTCTCDLAPNNSVEMRILFPSPRMISLDNNENVASIVINNGNQKFERISRSKLDIKRGWYTPELFGAENTYFVHAMIKDVDAFAQRAYYKFTDKDVLISIIEGPSIEKTSTWNLSFYFGPKEEHAISAVDVRLEQALSYAGFFAPLSKLFIKTLNFLNDFVGNYGLAIILLTILIKLLFLPLTIGGDARMKQQQELANQMSYLKQRFKDDPQRLAQEQAALIKKYGIPGLGCLPMLLQIPVFIAMRSVLAGSIELYHAPMLWINDLSARDPYYILPMMLVLAMFVQAAYAEKSQRTTLIAMGIVLGAFMANFAAGLVLYFVVHSLLAAIQTKCVGYFKRA